MAKLQNSAVSLAVLCTFFIVNVFLQPIHGKTIGNHGGLQEHQHKRSADGVIADMPSTISVDDPQVKKYAQQGVDKLSESSGGSKSALKKILSATYGSPAGKLLHEIKIVVNKEGNADDSKECTVNVWKESDAEPSVTIDCGQARKKRQSNEENRPRVMDRPIKLSEDNERAKKFAGLGVQKYAETSTDLESPVLVKIIEAYSYPPVGTMSHRIKILIASKTDGDKQKECTVKVWRKTGAEPSVTIDCGQARMKRENDGQPQIADLPTKLSVDDPQVKEFAQKGIEKVAQNFNSLTEPILEKILDATSFPPAGEISHEIKIKVVSKQDKDKSEECTVQVWRESGAEPSIGVECEIKNERKKRAKGDEPSSSKPYIADFPVELKLDDQNVKEYAKQGLEEYKKKFPGKDAVLVEILEAHYVPVSIYSYNIKVKFGKKAGNDKLEIETCNIYIPGDPKRFAIDIKCGKN